MPGCLAGQISDEQWPAAIEVEVEIGAHGVFLLPMGIGREDRCMGKGLQGLFFLSGRLADTLPTIRTKHAPPTRLGLVGNDNGRRYEPPPHDRVHMVSASMLSRRRSPTAVGKPSFACFKGYYLPRRRVPFRAELTIVAIRFLPDARAYGDPETMMRRSGI